MSGFSTECKFQVYNDGDGTHVDVGADADGLDLVEVRQVEDEKIVARITMHPDQADLLAKAIMRYIEILAEKNP